MDSEIDAKSCPTEPGFRTIAGFNPGLNWRDLLVHPDENWHIWGWMLCLLLILIIWIVTLVNITRHIRNYYDPSIQRHKLRVLLYPPVYATLAWFSYLRYDYSTTIRFFATLFESFAVFNLYICLQAYISPFREEAGDAKVPVRTKVLGLYPIRIKSKFGMHYRVITDILVFQYPIWAIIDALASIASEAKGYYCAETYNFHGAYVYLTIINFTSLSIILAALFTYLAVFEEEWKRGNITAHGMFWCVKGPIMIIFYFGDILLSILETKDVIKGTDGTQSGDDLAWPSAAVKNGVYVIIICTVMVVVSFMMLKYFGPQDAVLKHMEDDAPRMSGWMALVDGYLSYLPEFFHKVLLCGVDSYRLARKRAKLRARRRREMYTVGNNSTHALAPVISEDKRSSAGNNPLFQPRQEQV
ncbi:organic solute transporter Ostalpha-domain-containing protein [Dichotomocladium elegans]|nr:organic solute transporter Ostalpha-domain-containing protein [Dichotomocladium elegans]